MAIIAQAMIPSVGPGVVIFRNLPSHGLAAATLAHIQANGCPDLIGAASGLSFSALQRAGAAGAEARCAFCCTPRSGPTTSGGIPKKVVGSLPSVLSPNERCACAWAKAQAQRSF